mgnify:FL=1
MEIEKDDFGEDFDRADFQSCMATARPEASQHGGVDAPNNAPSDAFRKTHPMQMGLILDKVKPNALMEIIENDLGKHFGKADFKGFA